MTYSYKATFHYHLDYPETKNYTGVAVPFVLVNDVVSEILKGRAISRIHVETDTQDFTLEGRKEIGADSLDIPNNFISDGFKDFITSVVAVPQLFLENTFVPFKEYNEQRDVAYNAIRAKVEPAILAKLG